MFWVTKFGVQCVLKVDTVYTSILEAVQDCPSMPSFGTRLATIVPIRV
jgi:hypothetical protein